MMIQKIDHRKRKSKNFSLSALPLVIVVVLLIALVLIPEPGTTSKTISDFNITPNEYVGETPLTGLLRINMTPTDHIPLNMNVSFSILSYFPLYYVCGDAYDFEWYDINGTKLSTSPEYEFCNNMSGGTVFRDCKVFNKTCCPYGVSGKNYGNLLCSNTPEAAGYCGDKCIPSKSMFTFSDLVSKSTTPNKDNISIAQFKYSGINFDGAGPGYGYCYDNSGIEILEPFESLTCNDTDGGKNYLVLGSCKDLTAQYPLSDRCYEGQNLQEWYCNSVKVDSNPYKHCFNDNCLSAYCDRIGSFSEGWYSMCGGVEVSIGPIPTKCEDLDPLVYAPKCDQASGKWMFPPYCAYEDYSCGDAGSCSNGACFSSKINCSGWNNSYDISLSNLGLTAPSDLAKYLLVINFSHQTATSITGTILDINRTINKTFIVSSVPTHKACVGSQCVIVSGSGSDECQNDSQCQCSPTWRCGNWTSCSNGRRSRSCYDSTGCRDNYTQYENCTAPCNSYWTCAWQRCVGDVQKKVCTDAYNCTPSNSSYDLQIRDCCVEEWSCNQWGLCRDGVQTRDCWDSENCGTEFDKLPETQNCRETSGGTLFVWILIVIIAAIVVFFLVIKSHGFGSLFKSNKPRFRSGPGFGSMRDSFPKPSSLDRPQETPRAEPSERMKFSQLVNYMKRALKNGLSKHEIEDRLLRRGWPKSMVDDAFESLFS
ncbi:MAG: hypothetical protein JSW08_00585 [archaeon]|nr:MAG: hypothetical protein JSW08_00585 [archaeon]